MMTIHVRPALSYPMKLSGYSFGHESVFPFVRLNGHGSSGIVRDLQTTVFQFAVLVVLVLSFIMRNTRA